MSWYFLDKKGEYKGSYKLSDLKLFYLLGNINDNTLYMEWQRCK